MITMYLWREWRLVRPRMLGAIALLLIIAITAAFDAPRGARHLALYPDTLVVAGLLLGIVLFAGTTLVDGRCGDGAAFIRRMPGAFGPTMRANLLVTVAAIVLMTGIGVLSHEALAWFETEPNRWGAMNTVLSGFLPWGGASVVPWMCVAFVPWLWCAGGLSPRPIGVLPIGYGLLAIVFSPAIVLQNVTGLPLYYANDMSSLGLWSAICGLVAMTFVQRDRFRVRNPWWKALAVAAFTAVPVLGVGMWRADDLNKIDPHESGISVWDLRQTEAPHILLVELKRRIPGARVNRGQIGAVDLDTGTYMPITGSEIHIPLALMLPSEHTRLAQSDHALPGFGTSIFVGNAHRISRTGRHGPQWRYFDLTRRRVVSSPYKLAWPLRGEWVVESADNGADRYRLFDPDSATLRPVLGLAEGELVECVLDQHRVVVHHRREPGLTALDPVTGTRTSLTSAGPAPDGRFIRADVVHRTPSGAVILRLGFDRSNLYAKVDGDRLVCTALLSNSGQATAITETTLLASEGGKVFRLTFGSETKDLVFPR